MMNEAAQMTTCLYRYFKFIKHLKPPRERPEMQALSIHTTQ